MKRSELKQLIKEIMIVEYKTFTPEQIITYTDNRLKTWYKNAKIDYGVKGIGKTFYDAKNNTINIKYKEDGKSLQWKQGYDAESPIDQYFDIWMEQG